jgi:hypothetical protein
LNIKDLEQTGSPISPLGSTAERMMVAENISLKKRIEELEN